MSNHGVLQLLEQVVDSDAFADGELMKLLVWILSRVSRQHERIPVMAGRRKSMVSLAPGQCAISRAASAAELGWSPSTFRDRLKKLTDMGVVNVESAAHWSVLSIDDCCFTSSTTGGTAGAKNGTETTGVRQVMDNEYVDESELITGLDDRRPTGVRQAFCDVVEDKFIEPESDIQSPAESDFVLSAETIKKPKKQPAKFNPLDVDMPRQLDTASFRKMWVRWVEHRIEKRKPLTRRSTETQLEMLAEFGEARSIAAIRYTIAMGWQGIREAEVSNKPGGEEPPQRKLVELA